MQRQRKFLRPACMNSSPPSSRTTTAWAKQSTASIFCIEAFAQLYLAGARAGPIRRDIADKAGRGQPYSGRPPFRFWVPLGLQANLSGSASKDRVIRPHAFFCDMKVVLPQVALESRNEFESGWRHDGSCNRRS